MSASIIRKTTSRSSSGSCSMSRAREIVSAAIASRVSNEGLDGIPRAGSGVSARTRSDDQRTRCRSSIGALGSLSRLRPSGSTFRRDGVRRVLTRWWRIGLCRFTGVADGHIEDAHNECALGLAEALELAAHRLIGSSRRRVERPARKSIELDIHDRDETTTIADGKDNSMSALRVHAGRM